MEFLFILLIKGNSSVQDFFMETRNNFDDKSIPYQIWVKKLKNNPKNLLKSGKAGIDILSSGKQMPYCLDLKQFNYIHNIHVKL